MKLLTELDSLDNVKDGETRKLITKATSSGSGNVVSSISVSGDAITYTKGVTALTAHQNAFSKVKVGTTDVAADSAGDTLELVAGSNVTLTPDATNDKITIAASQPTVNNGTLTIQKNGTNVQTFSANQSGNATANITVPTKTSELTNDSGYVSDLSNYVTLNGAQTITGNKTFNGQLIMSDINNAKYTTSDTKNIQPSDDGLANPPWNRDLWHDHFAFLRYHSIDSQETSADGTTWTTANKNIKPLFNQKDHQSISILSADEVAYRFTFKNNSFAYSSLRWFEVAVGYTNPFSNFEVWIEHSSDNETWNTCHKSVITGNSRPYILYNGYSINSDGYTRFTFTKQNNLTTGTVVLSCIKGFCTRKGSQGLGIEYEYPYSWDDDANVLPISNNSKTLGNSSKTWSNVYATTFTGNLTGTASKATGDKNGNDITTTYVKKAGDTITGTLTINKDAAQDHLAFGRANYNYIRATASGGKFAFLTNGKTTGSTTQADLIIEPGVIRRGSDFTTADIGTSTYPWRNVYANTFNGDLTGLASKATGDKNGNDITTTYYKASNPNGYTSNTGTITGVSVNGTSVATSGVANITSVPASILSGAIPSAVTATTQTAGDSSTKLATTAFVNAALPKNIKDGSATGSVRTSDSKSESSSYTIGQYAFAEGYSTQASGKYSHAEGDRTIASDQRAHAEGLQTQATANAAHAEGSGTIASQGYAHAEGSNTRALSFGDHAEGSSTMASGGYSHAEGYFTTARGSYSHAEGQHNTDSNLTGTITAIDTTNLKISVSGIPRLTSGDYKYQLCGTASDWDVDCYITNASYASNIYTFTVSKWNSGFAVNGTFKIFMRPVAYGNGSHAEGQATYAFSDVTHAEGLGTVASGKAQHAQGKWNVVSSTYADIVGNGTDNANRSNAYTLDWDGNGIYAGKLTVGTGPSNNMDVATKKYVDDSITNLPEPMLFKGSLGTGGTITSLPTASASNEGYTYKVITAGTYASQAAKVGDTFISDGTAWVLIPSGDEPSGTVTSITLKATSPIAIDSSSAITTSGTRTLSHANSGVSAGTYRSVTVNATGHVTAGTNPTTLSGYGITDAKIDNGVITLGSNTITPLTSHQDISGKLDKSGGAITGAITRSLASSGTIANTNLFTVSGSTDGFKVDYASTTADVGITTLSTTDDANAKISIGNTVSSTYKEAIGITNGSAVINGYTVAAASAKAVDTSISAASTSANLPTSAAVASFVEGKGYVTLAGDQTITGIKTFSNAKGFVYSGIETATSSSDRPVWFNDSSTTGKPVINATNFKYNPSTNILTTGTYTSTAGKLNLTSSATIQYNSTDKCIEFNFV